MFKFLFIAVSLIFSFALHANNELPLIILNGKNLNTSFTNQVDILEDEKDSIDIESLINNKSIYKFHKLNHVVSNIDFTTSSFWIRFTLNNQSEFSEFILETARPITNIARFYEVKNGKIFNTYQNGDDFKFNEKVIKHRKILFPIHIERKESIDYYIQLKSDGEVITLPLIVSDNSTFFLKDSKQQFINGVYFGMLLLIIIIYFFFYVFLQDKTFFFYISYVAGIFLMQFALDGYGYQYLFPSGGYFANHSILFFAAITIVLLLQYAQSYLNLKKNNLTFLKAFRGLQVLMLVLAIVSLIPGKAYELMYPTINGVSLISTIMIVYSIYYLKFTGIKICNFFTSAFTILIAGAVLFILGNFNILVDPIVSQNALKFSSGLEIIVLSISMARKYKELQRAKEEIQQLALESLTEKNRIMDNMNSELEKQVKSRTNELNIQKETLEDQNEEILSSIKYAKRIQQAILPSDEKVKGILPDSFVFYLPKDVVSGDFYFIEKTVTSNENRSLSLFAAVDCTGHGVPGAFMSLVGNSYLKQSLTESHVNSTGDCLDFLNEGVCSTLTQKSNQTVIRDGMDIALGAIDYNDNLLYFSGAKNPVFIIRNEILPEIEISKRNPTKSKSEELFLNEIKGDKHPIGNYIGETLQPFSTHVIKLKKGDVLYVFSDGFPDQFGGPRGKKYNSKHFKLFLLSISQLSMEKQRELIEKEFFDWKGDLEQVDDLCVIGIRI